MAGLHSQHILLVADEASGVDEAVYAAAGGSMSTPGSITLLIGKHRLLLADAYAGACEHFGTRLAGGAADPAMRQRLEWLESEPAPAVATDPPFRSNSAPATLATQPNDRQQVSEGCCWEEKPPGYGTIRRCGDQVVPGRPWCALHCRAHALGKGLQGKLLGRGG
jgi:hypothetical protein